MTAEERLLCLSARLRPSLAAQQEMHCILAAGCDVARVAELAEHNGVNALVFSTLSRIEEGLDRARAWQPLRARAVADALNSLQVASSTRELLKHLRNYSVIPLKGAALAQQLYGQFSLRHFGDIDLLVRREDVLSIWQDLVAHGYHSADNEQTLYPLLRSRDEKHVTLRSPDGVAVEVHWSFHEPAFRFRLPANEVFARAIPFVLAGLEVRVACSEDLLILLTVHGCRHGWESLKWICDVAELLSNQAPDVDRALSLAAQLGTSRMLLLGLRLAHELLDAPLPPSVAAHVNDGVLDDLTVDVMGKLFRSSRVEGEPTGVTVARAELDSLDFDARCRDSRRDRLALTLYHVLSKVKPTLHERALLRQPWVPAPLFWILRPFRLLRHYGPTVLWASLQVVGRILTSSGPSSINQRPGRS